MTSPHRILTLLAAGTLALGLSACASTGDAQRAETESPTPAGTAEADAACTGSEGVTLTVDSSALKGGSSETWCIIGTGSVTISNALNFVGVSIEGTKQYGDQVVCRVNGLPSASAPVGSAQDPAYIEECDAMPAAFAYWALWIKPADGAWDYAQEGLSTLTAQPGESVELLFTLDGAPAAPSS
ncbi:hypothetical protein PP359_11930 [Sphingomonas sp. BLCC-B65]|nr:hypothetical protein [Sphingomonas sp. BLCC-B65]